MFQTATHGGTASVSLALALMPVGAAAHQAAASPKVPAPPVRVTVEGADFVIAARNVIPPTTTDRRAVPIGLSTVIDRAAFEPVARGTRSIRP